MVRGAWISSVLLAAVVVVAVVPTGSAAEVRPVCSAGSPLLGCDANGPVCLVILPGEVIINVPFCTHLVLATALELLQCPKQPGVTNFPWCQTVAEVDCEIYPATEWAAWC